MAGFGMRRPGSRERLPRCKGVMLLFRAGAGAVPPRCLDRFVRRPSRACQRGGPPLSSATIRATASVLLVLSTHLPLPKAHFGVHDCPTTSSGCPMTTSSLSRPHRHAARVNAALLARDIREPTMHCRSLTAAAAGSKTPTTTTPPPASPPCPGGMPGLPPKPE